MLDDPQASVSAKPLPSPAAPAAVADSEGDGWPTRAVLYRRVLMLAVTGLGLTALFASRISVCPVVNLTGHPCPGCGLTRATLAALTGHFSEAVRLQPLVFFATPMVAICACVAIHSYLKTGRVRFSNGASRILTPPLTVMYVALTVLWIARFCGALGGPVPVDSSLFTKLSNHSMISQ